MNYFFGQIVKEPSLAQSFFLIERVSNIRKSLLVNKIIATIRAAEEHKILSKDDIKELIKLYKEAVDSGKVIDSNGGIKRLATQLNA